MSGLLALATFLVYYRALGNPFTNYDDGEYVKQNPAIQNGVTPAFLKWAFTSTEHANWHPVTWISHAIDWRLFGDQPWGHHLTSLLLHILCAILLFLFLFAVTDSALKSAGVAALFALHPVSVESVVWISERKNVLCAVFFFACLSAYAWYARKPRITRYLATLSLFALGLGSKAMVVTLPFVLLLLDYWPLARVERWNRQALFPKMSLSRLVIEKVPFLFLSAAVSVVTVLAQRRASAIRPVSAFPLMLRLENAIVSYVGYLWNTVWPLKLAVLYSYPSAGIAAGKVAGSLLALVAISYLAWRERQRRPYLIVGWCWFVGMMVPVIGLVQVGEQGMADRYAYLPLVGIYTAMIWAASDFALSAARHTRRLMGISAAALLAAMCFLTWRQIGFWKTNLELWSHTVAVTERNYSAEDVVGSELLMAAMNRGEHYSDEALPHFQNALAINPKDSQALLYLGMDLQARGRISEAIEKYGAALNFVDDQWTKSKVLSGIAACYERQGDFLTARRYYNEALQVNPRPDSESFMGFARTLSEEEIVKVTIELRQHPTAAGFWKLGQLQDGIGAKDSARESYERARQLDPRFRPQ